MIAGVTTMGTMGTMSATYNFDAPGELEEQLEAAVKDKNNFDEWKTSLASYCLKIGTSMPNGIPLQRMWNAEQRRRATRRKLEKRAEIVKEELVKIGKLLEENELEYILPEAMRVKARNDAGELAEPDWDAVDADMLRLQESLESKNKEAKRQQDELFSSPATIARNNEPTLPPHKEYEDGHIFSADDDNIENI